MSEVENLEMLITRYTLMLMQETTTTKNIQDGLSTSSSSSLEDHHIQFNNRLRTNISR